MRRSIRSSFVFVDGDGDVDVAFNGPAAVEGAGRSSQRKVKQKSSGQKTKQTNKKTKKFPFFFSWFRVDKAENVSFRSSTDDFNETKKRITRTQNEKSKRERERERENGASQRYESIYGRVAIVTSAVTLREPIRETRHKRAAECKKRNNNKK